MKSILITFDQAHYNRIVTALEKLNCRGYTALEQVQGRGSRTGEPHLGSHAWPSMNSAILTMVDDHRVQSVLDTLRKFDEESPLLGLRAFVWNIESYI